MRSQFPPGPDYRPRGSPPSKFSAESLRAAAEIGLAIAVAAVAAGAAAIVRDTPAMQAAARQQLAEEIARDNNAFCNRRGLVTGTHEHLLCTMELNEIRNRPATEPVGSMELP